MAHVVHFTACRMGAVCSVEWTCTCGTSGVTEVASRSQAVETVQAQHVLVA